MCVHKNSKTARSLLDSLCLDDPVDNCDYQELNKTIDNHQSDLSAVHLNIRGLNSKLGGLVHLIDNSFKYRPPEIVMLCETWLKSNSPRPNVPGYNLERHDRKRKQGGGTGVLISTKCRYRRRQDLEEPDCQALESCFIELENKKRNVIFGSIYRPPNSSPDEFICRFNQLINRINNDSSKTDIVIGLDHNMDLLKHRTHRPTRLFVETLYELGLAPVITKPTHIAHSSATLIDNILVSHKLIDNTNQGIICDDTSDHLPCYILMNDIHLMKKEDQFITTRDLREANLIALKKKLSEGVLLPDPMQSVNEQFNYFHNTLTYYIERFILIVTRKLKPKAIRREKWVCPGLLRSIRKSKQLYTKYITNKTNNKLHDKYKRYNQILQKTKRYAQKILLFGTVSST